MPRATALGRSRRSEEEKEGEEDKEDGNSCSGNKNKKKKEKKEGSSSKSNILSYEDLLKKYHDWWMINFDDEEEEEFDYEGNPHGPISKSRMLRENSHWDINHLQELNRYVISNCGQDKITRQQQKWKCWKRLLLNEMTLIGGQIGRI
jgi:hypothetical protein